MRLMKRLEKSSSAPVGAAMNGSGMECPVSFISRYHSAKALVRRRTWRCRTGGAWEDHVPDLIPSLYPMNLLVLLTVLFIDRRPLGLVNAAFQGGVAKFTSNAHLSMFSQPSKTRSAVCPREDFIAPLTLNRRVDALEVLPRYGVSHCLQGMWLALTSIAVWI
jgi:hypothetical protein